MTKQGYSVKGKGFRKITVLKFLLSALILTFPFTLSPSPLIYAQEISPTVKKNVVKNFKVNLAEYSAFGSDCSKKAQGDANCDGAVNDFDLSVWQVEFNAAKSPMRSDFNSDGLVNLLDFGIWRNTVYSAKLSGRKNSLNYANELIGRFSAFIFSLVPRSALAQETASGGGEINSSSAFISDSGNSLVVNDIAGGNTQQVNFNPEGDPLTAQVFDVQGDALAAISYLDSGNTIISTEESGIQIALTQTSAGPVIENFKNPDGSLIAIKSWPTQDSYTRGDPPQAVTLPGKDNNSFLTLNIQPNGNSLLQEVDKNGNIINLSYLTGNGIYGSYNTQNDSQVTSLASAKVTSIALHNNLGGKTIYNIIDNLILSVTQTDSKNNTWIATPQGNYDSWELIQINSGQENTTIVPDPMKAINSTSPSPLDLIKTWNYYLTAAKTSSPEIDFTTGFNTNIPALSRQVTAANEFYKIAQTPTPPDVLGIVREAYAQQTAPAQCNNCQTVTPTSDGTPPGGVLQQKQIMTQTGLADGWAGVQVGTQWGVTQVQSQPNGTVTVTNYPNTSTGRANGFERTYTVPPGSLPTTINGWNAFGGSLITQSSNINGALAAGTAADTVAPPAAPPAAPAAPPVAPVAPVAPAAPAVQTGTQFAGIPTQTCSGACGTAMTNLNAFEEAKKAAEGNLTVEQWAAQQNSARPNSVPPAQVADMQAIQTTHQAFSQQVKSALEDKEGLFADALAGKLPGANGELATQPGLFGAAVAAFRASGLSLDESIQKAQAIQTSVLTTATGLPSGTPAGTLPGVIDTKAAPGSAGAAPPGATAQPPDPPRPPPGVSANFPTTPGVTVDGRFNNLDTKTTLGADGFWTTEINGGREKPGGATHHFGYDKNGKDGATSLVEFFDKADGTRTTVRDGVMTNIEGKIDGQQISIDLGAGTFSIPAGLTAEQATSFAQQTTSFAQQQLAERAYSQGFKEGDIVDSWSVANDGSVTQNTSALMGMSTCFLAGTSISTPNGAAAIETLEPGDKVYSHNEKTGRKQISDFKELDINFVDEYLIINGKIRTTVYHPFYTVIPNASEESVSTLTDSSAAPLNDKTLKTVRADVLKIGDILPTEEGKYVPVYSIEKVNAPKTTVYNLMEVSPNNNFFAEEILVHNYGGPENFDSNSLNEISSWSGDGYGNNEGDSGQSEAQPAEAENTDPGDQGGGSTDVSSDVSSSWE